MASELRVDTLKDSSGNNSVGMSYVSSGSAKFWIKFNGTGTPAADDSFNAASITDNGTGLYDHNFTSSMGSANYSKTYGGTGTTSDSHMKHYGSVEESSTASILKTHSFHNSDGTQRDEPDYCATVHGDLA